MFVILGGFGMDLLSVIIPSFNEEENIQNTAQVVASVLRENGIRYEILFVDDGSRDATYARMCAAAQADPQVRGIRLSRNFGKEGCIFAGLNEARGNCCVVIDCDLQHPPQVIPQMYRLWQQGYDIVEGVKSSRGRESAFYRMSAGLFYKLMSKFTKVDLNATSDFKLLDRKVVNVLTSLPERNTFFRALTFWAGFRSTQVEFDVQERVHGESKWSLLGLIRYAVRNVTSFTTVPLQLVTGLGIACLAAFIVVGLQTFIRFCMGRSAEGFTTVILLLLFIGGAIMVSLGIIGHYIARIFDEVKGRPKYIISECTPGKEAPAEDAEPAGGNPER